MANHDQYDAGHFSFLELLRALNKLAGPGVAKIMLLKIGMQAASEVPEREYATLEKFIESIKEMDNPISQFEGEANYYGEGIFSLPKCPFAKSIASYKGVKGKLPEDYGEITETLNKPSASSDLFRIAEGAAVSPFCGVHQPIRSALGGRIKIGGQQLKVYQLGCKSGSGKKGLSYRWINEAQLDPDVVDRILNDNMCCDCFRFEPRPAPLPVLN
jgi:hypothetical protein